MVGGRIFCPDDQRNIAPFTATSQTALQHYATGAPTKFDQPWKLGQNLVKELHICRPRNNKSRVTKALFHCNQSVAMHVLHIYEICGLQCDFLHFRAIRQLLLTWSSGCIIFWRMCEISHALCTGASEGRAERINIWLNHVLSFAALHFKEVPLSNH